MYLDMVTCSEWNQVSQICEFPNKDLLAIALSTKNIIWEVEWREKLIPGTGEERT